VAGYRFLIKPSATKELENLSKVDRQRLVQKIQSLSNDPRPHACEKLSGEEKYRIRQGGYRVVHSIDDEVHEVTIFKVAHRREAYRKS
jgi:mRNA interferase RelE/StbE